MNKKYNVMITTEELRDMNIVHIGAMEVGPNLTVDEFLDYLKTTYGESNTTIMVDNSLTDDGFYDELIEKTDKKVTVIYNMAEFDEYKRYTWKNKITGIACFRCIEDHRYHLLRINDSFLKPYQKGNILLFIGHDNHTYSLIYLDKNLMPIKIVACYDLMDANFSEENIETKIIGEDGNKILERIPLSDITWLNAETIKNIKEQ